MTSVATSKAANGDTKKSKPNPPADKQVFPYACMICHVLSTYAADTCHRVQEFLAIFDKLKEELVNDSLIEGQPEFSRTWMQRVSAVHGNFLQRRPLCLT